MQIDRYLIAYSGGIDIFSIERNFVLTKLGLIYRETCKNILVKI